MQQYLQHEHYALWKVIEFGYSYEVPENNPSTTTTSTTSGEKSGRTVTLTTEDMLKKKNDAVILKTFGGNEATKKMKKNLLKQQYGNFKAEGSETLEHTFTRLQVIVGQLQFMGVEVEQDDLNQKLLTSLAPEWLMHTIVWRNMSDLDTMSLDDLYNHLKVYEAEVQNKSKLNTQNMAFISSTSYSRGNDEVNTANVYTASSNVPTASVNVTTANINQINEDDIEEMDIKWNMALLSMRADKFWKKTGKKISIQGSDVAGFDKSKVECFNCHKMGPFAREYRVGWDWSYMENEEEDHALVAEAPIEFALMANTSTENKVFDNSLCSKDCKKNNDSLNSKITDLTDKLFDAKNMIYHYKLALAQVESRLVEYKEREVKYIEKIRTLEYYDKGKKECIESLRKELKSLKQEKEAIDGKLAGLLTASKDLDNLIESQRSDKSKEGLGYTAIPPPTAQLYLSPKKDLSWTGLPDSSPITPKQFVKFVKASDSQSKSKTDEKETPKKPPVKDAKQYKKPNKKPNDSGCSRHMTGNISYLSDFEPFDRGYVSFGQGGCQIIGKGTIKTGKLEFENVYFVKDLKHNLVRGPPTKCFENNHNCTACLKGKQHKASCYNGGEFRNKELNDFCTQNGIKREFSNARTTQQNGVAKRRNRSLIEAARTMLADAKLPVTFWAEAINTACYVQNRVLVNKAHNKTPYELFNGRTLAIGFLKPFGCHVMILNTLDNLGKFESKGDEGYFLGYSMSSKAFRVFNKRTKRVEENMHIEFLENKAIEKGYGPNWLFDIDYLTKSMNYVPVVDACTNSTNFLGTKVDARKDVKKDVSSLRYIVLPNWVYEEHLESISSQPQDPCNTDAPESSGNSNPTATSTNPSADQVETLTVETPIPTIFNALQDPSWVEAMQEELLQFKIQNVWTLVDYPKGLCREFEALMHEKFQMSAMGELNFFLGLQVLQKEDGIFLSQDKYVGDILKKFGYTDVRSSNTHMDKENPWGKEGTGKDVDLHLYRSMIGSLMYLTTSRPDIMFAVCACARHQVTPKECHLHAVKRIFRYLKGHPKLGLWYPKGSPFDLVSFSDSDYGGATQDRKSTNRGCQFLGRRLISWQCKKQTIVATSTTKAEYVTAASCCGQVLWIQNQLLDYGYNFINTKIYIDNNSAIYIVKNHVYQSKTKHIEIKHHL
nr:putative ribonuclease H-like domain-containing protein [Tanacetum cinerariifolium]